MAAKGYGTYHGRSRLRTALKVVIVLLVVLLVLAVATPVSYTHLNRGRWHRSAAGRPRHTTARRRWGSPGP